MTFAYPGADEPVLKDINFISNPGEITAITVVQEEESPAL